MSGNVCRFFLNNNCRYGDRCRYSHNVSERSYSPSSNPYVYVRDEPRHSGSGGNYKQNLSTAEVHEVVERIAEEAKQIEYEKMWPLTCLSVLKDSANVPGWTDFSVEEIRAAAYATKAAGRFNEYIQFFNSLKQKARENRETFLKRTRKADEIVRGMFELRKQEPDQTQSSSSSNAFANPFFGNTASGTTASFGSSPSIFGGTSSTPNQAIPFGSASKEPAQGIFAMAARGFSQSPFFAQTPVQQSDSLNETEMETATDITTHSTTVSPFQQNIFGQVSQQNQPPSVFQTASAPLSSTPVSTVSGTVTAIYTPISALSPMDLDQFKATTFTLETLPLVPPPREFC